MDIKEIRKLIIQAIAADDILMGLLVLKGGNALDIVHRFNLRTSLDLDFSISGDFENTEEVKNRLFDSLNHRFDSKGLVTIDEKFLAKPKGGAEDPTWGGYRAEFKLVNKKLIDQLKDDLDGLRRNSLSIGDSNNSRIFSIEISKYEWIKGAELSELDGFKFRVYTLPMIAVEKLRAICQQMQEYPLNKTPKPRARDFFDIYSVTELIPKMWQEEEVEDLIYEMFATKKVSLDLINLIKNTKDFHQSDWNSVVSAANQSLESFDYYFDSVMKIIEELDSFWIK